MQVVADVGWTLLSWGCITALAGALWYIDLMDGSKKSPWPQRLMLSGIGILMVAVPFAVVGVNGS